MPYFGDQTPPDVIDDISAMYRTNYMGFASFTLLIWDHVDTFETEVEFIWKGRKGLLVYLFLINRYLTPLGFIVNLFAYLSPVWTPDTCSRFIRFEGSMTVIGINIVALMMFIRIRALYHRQYYILGFVTFLGLFQLCMNAWLLTKGVAVVHNERSGVLACTMIFDPAISSLASSSAWLPLLYDTVVLGLTLAKTLPSLRNRNTAYVMKRLLEDGLIYYSAIFAVTAVLTFMIVAAPPGLKNITAQLELLLTVTMMSRITLNLKKSVNKLKDTVVRPQLPSMFTQNSQMNVDPGIKIVAPGFNQASTVDSIDFGVAVPMSNLNRNGAGGSRGGGGGGIGSKMITIVSPKKARLSTITQEGSEWERSGSTASRSDQERARDSPREARDRQYSLSSPMLGSFGSFGLRTIDESRKPS